MAFGILQTFLARLRQQGGEFPELSSTLRQYQAHENEYEEVTYEIPGEERPPMLDVPAYRKLRGMEE